MYSNEWKEKIKDFIEKIRNDNKFAKKYGNIGPVYGKQWIQWEAPDGETINQIQNAVDMIKKKKFGRMAAIQRNKIVSVSLKEAIGKPNKVDDELYDIAKLFFE